MVDLARIKLYSNQAVMTADNYGEAVISMYRNSLYRFKNSIITIK